MQDAERIEAIAAGCRAIRPPLPESLISAMCQYLAGNGSLPVVQQEWQRVAHTASLFSPAPYYFTPLLHIVRPNVGSLDDMDLRMLDICTVTGAVSAFFSQIAATGPVAQAYDYLLSKGMSEQDILLQVMACYYLLNADQKPNALGRLLLKHITQQYSEIRELLFEDNHSRARRFIFKALLSTRPAGYLDLAGQIAQTVSPEEADDYAPALLEAEPARFTDWARQVALATVRSNQPYQHATLKALLRLDPAQHIDLAIEAAHAPLGRQRWDNASLQWLGVQAAYWLDPVKYLALVEEAAIAPNSYLGKGAVGLLEWGLQKWGNFEQARPILQRCIASGDIEAALKALDVLLKHDWPERQTYMLSLLSHCSKQVREGAIEWLLPQGQALIDQISPLLADKSAYARLAAVQILVRLGGERARALLAKQREVEKSSSVKQTIVDAIGLPEPPADLDPATAIAALQAEAAKDGKKSPLRWYTAEEPTGLRWINGDAVPVSVLYYLLTCQARMRQMQLDVNVRRVRQWLDPRTTGALALTLFTGWVKQGGSARESWCLPLIAALGDDRLVQLLRRQIDTLRKRSRSRTLGPRAVQTLALIDSDLALTEVSDLARHAQNGPVQRAAREAFAEAAQRQGLALEELADRIAPRLGFNEHGEQTLDFGPRQFSARLGFDLTVHLKDGSGKQLTLLPRPNARDDAAKVATAQAAWQVLKKHLTPAINIQAARLENALSTQRAWSVERWRALFLQHPLLRSLAINLVWGVLDAAGTGYDLLFRPLEDGSLTTADDDACALPTDGQIRLVHPIELDEETRSAWLQHLTDYEITPPFPQLNRPIITLDEAARENIWWKQYEGYRVPGKLLKEQYQRRDWVAAEEDQGEIYNLIWKAFPGAGARATGEIAEAQPRQAPAAEGAGIEALLEISYLVAGHERNWPATLIRLGFGRAGTVEAIKQASIAAQKSTENHAYDYYQPQKVEEAALLKLADVPPVVFSEAAASVQAFAALGYHDADWQKRPYDASDDADMPF